MSSFDPNNPFDDGHPWQNVSSTSSTSAWRSTQPQPKKQDFNAATTTTTTTTATSSNTRPAQNSSHPPSTSSSIHRDQDAREIPAAIPITPPHAPATSSTHGHQPTSEIASALMSAAAAAAAVGTGGKAIVPGSSSDATGSGGPSEELPPSYEAIIIKNRPQLHDNYDHLRGPPGQRGQDLKTRIPLDSTPASHYQTGSGGSGSSAGARYGSISPQQQPTDTSSRQHLRGQVSQGREDDELHSRDVDRLLGADQDHSQAQDCPHHHYAVDEPETHWGTVGDSKAWVDLCYLLIVLFPWAIFCFVWSLVSLIIAGVSMLVPPVGYVFVIAAVTSWRALARVDLVMSQALVASHVREKHPYVAAKVFVSVPEPPQAHMVVVTPSVGPVSSGHESVNGTPSSVEASPVPVQCNHHHVDDAGLAPPMHRLRTRRSRNCWHKGSEHIKAAIGNKHTVGALSYFLVWKFAFASVAFVFMVILSVLSIPFMICLLPTLLIVSRKLAQIQYRWSVFWLSEKSQPIALP